MAPADRLHDSLDTVPCQFPHVGDFHLTRYLFSMANYLTCATGWSAFSALTDIKYSKIETGISVLSTALAMTDDGQCTSLYRTLPYLPDVIASK